MIVVDVPLAERSYPVLVGTGARHELNEVLPAGTRRVAVVTNPEIPWAVEVDREHRTFTIPDGEPTKRLSTIEGLCEEFASWGLSRADCVVAVGGGIVTDVAGFAAAVYHRGIPVVHVATTLLAQIDAAIGGKTGVNLEHGKNLVGAYWQPAAVLCDTEMLSTLPQRERLCGFGELAKYHWLGGGRLDELELDEQVAACVRIKAEVVAADEREGGRRAVLNYGHTLAHAIEIAGGHDLRHGEAVAVGLIYAAELALRLGRIDEASVAEHRRVIARYDLPSRLPGGLDHEALLGLFARDKKATHDVTFMLLDRSGAIGPVSGIPREALLDSLVALT